MVNKRNFVPYEIEFLIQMYTRPDDARTLVKHAPMYQQTVNKFASLGLINCTEGVGIWNTTEKGKALVKLICCTPIPIEGWIDPSTNEQIKDD